MLLLFFSLLDLVAKSNYYSGKRKKNKDVCFPKFSEKYIGSCFTFLPKENLLISHEILCKILILNPLVLTCFLCWSVNVPFAGL